MNVSGFLVDAAEAPVLHGSITVFFAPLTTKSHVTESLTVLNDGFFGLETHWRTGKDLKILMEERPIGFFPIDRSALLKRKFFRGVTISRYSRNFELGKVSNYVRYGQAIIDVTQCRDELVAKIKRHEIYFNISDSDKRLIASGSFAPALDERKREVVFNIPEGVWHLDLVDKETGGTVRRSEQLAIVRGKAVELVL